ncbi:MAG: hypothetical protein WBW71_00400 [Bacteroidota bacterium]
MKRLMIALLLFFPMIGFAGEQSPKAIAEQFLSSLPRQRFNASYDQLFNGSSISTDNLQAIENLKSQTEKLLPLYGGILGYELVHEEDFGTSIVRLVYILKQEKHATVWEFYFYKPRSFWFLSNIRFNDQFNFIESKE